MLYRKINNYNLRNFHEIVTDTRKTVWSKRNLKELACSAVHTSNVKLMFNLGYDFYNICKHTHTHINTHTYIYIYIYVYI